MKTLRALLLLIMMILCLSSCLPKNKIVYKDVPEGYVIIDKKELVELMNNCTECKQELTNCLNSKKER